VLGSTRSWWRQLPVPLAVLAILVIADQSLPPTLVLSGSFSIAALVASAFASVRVTIVVGALALVMAAISGLWNHNTGSLEWWVRLTDAVILAGLAVLIAAIRTRRESDVRRMTVIADAAQRALLRAMPQSVGSVGLAARYVSATEAARVGGDLYEVTETPFGVRVIVGDVRGKGLDAVQMAATVLASFRHASFLQPLLGGVAAELDHVVSDVAEPEDFVTALLAEFHDDGTVTVVNCGHPPPLLVPSAAPATVLDTGEPQHPLGLRPSGEAVTLAWPARSRLLLFTDGLVETRDGTGTYFPLLDNALLLSRGSLDEALDNLLRRLRAHAAQRLDDDIALVLAERRAQPADA
jgi:serine phosphatase RsbU (regulator of sigma subunit)